MKNPKLSIIIPVYNEEENISKCIESLRKQSYKNFEIIVVDDGSTDKTREMVKKFKKVRLIIGQHKGPGFSRNLGAKKAKGKILVFVDADMTFDKNYLKYLIRPIVEDDVIGTEEVYQLASNLDNVWSKCWGMYSKGPKEILKSFKKGSVRYGHIFRAILKLEFEKMGGFDPSLGYADDQTFWIKYQIKPIVATNAKCYHKNPETLKDVYKQSRWIGASINNKTLEMPIVKHLAPILMIPMAPIAIPLLSIRKSYRNKDFKILIPWMLIFMTVRYFGTINGIFRKVYLNKNVR